MSPIFEVVTTCVQRSTRREFITDTEPASGMKLDKQDGLLAAVALARFSVDFEHSHPATADRAERLSARVIDYYETDADEVVRTVFER